MRLVPKGDILRPMRKDPLYFIAIVLPEDLQTEVTAFKHHIAQTWGPRHALRSPPHITLQPPFAWPDQRLPALQDCLRAFAAGQKCFYVHLKNFDAFPPRVIFVKPAANPGLEKLFSRLTAELEAKLGWKDARNERPFHAHVTIAHRDLEAGQFPAVWQYFKGQTYERVFAADNICLLKLVEGSWQVLHQYGLG